MAVNSMRPWPWLDLSRQGIREGKRKRYLCSDMLRSIFIIARIIDISRISKRSFRSLTFTRGTRYNTQAYCSHCGKWAPQSLLVSDARGNLRCSQCKKRVRTKPRRHFEKENKGKLKSFLESVRTILALSSHSDSFSNS